jgi:D-alanine transfer protein
MVTRERFLDRVENSREWQDLDLLLQVLTELGARPLLMSMPLNGPLYDARGISRSDREIYYQKLRTAVARHGLPLADFSEFDGDPRFLVGPGGHPSMRGWTYYVRTLDEFRRDTRP